MSRLEESQVLELVAQDLELAAKATAATYGTSSISTASTAATSGASCISKASTEDEGYAAIYGTSCISTANTAATYRGGTVTGWEGSCRDAGLSVAPSLRRHGEENTGNGLSQNSYDADGTWIGGGRA